MFLLTAYNLVFAAGLALLTPLHLLRLCFRSKHRRSTLPRLGWQKLPTPDPGDKVVWIHSCSVGETQVSRTLCRELRKRDPKLKIYLSTITETGQEVAAQILKDSLCDGHFYFPVDVAPIMSRILDQLHPSAFVVVETDLWYCCMELCRRRNIPCILVNGKISERSLERYLKLPFFAKALLRPFRQLLVQSSTYRDRFYTAGFVHGTVEVTGNLKLDMEVVHPSPEELDALAAELGLDRARPMVVFGSTHASEEELALATHRILLKQHPDLQTLIVPRHPERFAGVADMLRQEGAAFNRASVAATKPEAICLVDRMGLLMKLYALADVGVVCGSFTPHVGGHNILEPSFYSKPFVCGPWLYKQPGFADLNAQFGAGIQCRAQELPSFLSKLIADPNFRHTLGNNGHKLIADSKGAAGRSSAAIMKLIS